MFAAAVRFFLATGGGDQQRQPAVIKTLSLELYLVKELDPLLDAARLVGAAVARGEVRGLELELRTEKGRVFLAAKPERVVLMLRYARRLARLLRRAPAAATAVSGSLRKLALHNLAFEDPSPELAALLRACAALEELALDNCGFVDGDFSSALAVDAPPRSRLRVLSFDYCDVGRVHVVQLPGLVSLVCKDWFSESCPVTFGPASVPLLEEILLSNRAYAWQKSFSLSELLENTRGVETIRLSFEDNKIWVRPEVPRNLDVAFNNLKMLHLVNIFTEGDLSWTMFLLQAAPLLEFLHIEVYRDDLVCFPDDDDDEEEYRDVGDVIEWEVPQGFRHHHLRELRVAGGIDAGKHVRFARLVVERAVTLELLVLDAMITCQGCINAWRQDQSIVLSEFPDDKEGVDALVRQQVKGGIATSARVLVYSPSNQEFQYYN